MTRLRLSSLLVAVLSLGASLTGCPSSSPSSPPAPVTGAPTSLPVIPTAPSPPGPEAAFAAVLPEAPEKLLVVGRCTICHDERYLAQQRLTPKQWEQTVVKMKGFGSPVTDEELPRIAGYLSRSFPVDLPESPPVLAAKPVVPYR